MLEQGDGEADVSWSGIRGDGAGYEAVEEEGFVVKEAVADILAG